MITSFSFLYVDKRWLKSSECKTKGNKYCDIPFEFKGKKYSACINVDNGDEPWCFTNTTTMEWEVCSISSCPELKGKFLIILFKVEIFSG